MHQQVSDELAVDPRAQLTPKRVQMHSKRYANAARRGIDVPNVTDAVVSVLRTPSQCVPQHAVMLSMATTHHMKLRQSQFARVVHLQCFMARVVSVCYGFTDEYGTCVYGSCNKSLGLANPCLPSDYRRSQYVALNWAKWPLFIDTLRVARSALWLEADVVILQNPWELLLADAQRTATVHDAVRYQFESPPCTIPALVASPAVACVKSDWPTPHPEELNWYGEHIHCTPAHVDRRARACVWAGRCTNGSDKAPCATCRAQWAAAAQQPRVCARGMGLAASRLQERGCLAAGLCQCHQGQLQPLGTPSCLFQSLLEGPQGACCLCMLRAQLHALRAANRSWLDSCAYLTRSPVPPLAAVHAHGRWVWPHYVPCHL